MSEQAENLKRSAWPHRMAWLLACATLTLILAGGIVTTTDSGMAFKDWMTSDGTFFLWYDWLSSSGDKFIEHGHRLLGALAGFLAIGLVVACFASEDRSWVRKFSLAILAGVILQGLLGGARVVFDQRTLALIHGCTGPLFFAMTAAMVVVTSRWWRQTDPSTAATSNLLAAKTFRLSLVCASLAYGQLVVGAVVRHSPDLTGRLTATIFQVAVYFHVLLALLILCHVLLLAWRCLRTGLQRFGGACLLTLVGAQLLLGMSTWVVKYGMPQWAMPIVGTWNVVNRKSDVTSAAIITGHMVVGSLILIVSVAVALRLGRQLRVRLPRYATADCRISEVAS
ncbi:MAG: COX15/CtaA family protein [Planctomycetota bacterium]